MHVCESVPITIWGAKENLDLLKRDRDDGISRVVVAFDSAKGDKILLSYPIAILAADV